MLVNLTPHPVNLYGNNAVEDGRDDLLAPYVEVRNEAGTVIGCRYLQRVC